MGDKNKTDHRDKLCVIACVLISGSSKYPTSLLKPSLANRQSHSPGAVDRTDSLPKVGGGVWIGSLYQDWC